MSLMNRLKWALSVPAQPAEVAQTATPFSALPVDGEAARAALFAGWALCPELFGIPSHWTLWAVDCEGDAAGECEAHPEYGHVHIGLNLEQINTADYLCLTIAHELCHAADACWLGGMNQIAALLTGPNQRAAGIILTQACEFAVQQRMQSEPGRQLLAHVRAAYLAALQETT